MADTKHIPSSQSTDRQRLSVIIPARNEASGIGRVLGRLRSEGVDEIIVADGASVDRTAAIARSYGARVIISEPGRGRQMNAGAAAASGEILLFLHADTVLPRGFVRCIEAVLSHPETSAGAFGLRIDATGALFRVIEAFVDFRSRCRQTPYGDQAMFLTRDTFETVGGFPDWPVMEDVEMASRLRRVGRIRIASASVETSARRWLDHGVWRTTFVNQLCLAAYHMHIPTEHIARWRALSAHRPIAQPVTH